MRAPAFLIALLLLTAAAAASDDEAYFRLHVRGPADVDRLTRMVSIDNVRNDTVYGYAAPAEWTALLAAGYAPVRLPHPGDLGPHAMASTAAAMAEWDRYPTYQGYLAMMRQFAESHPAICMLDTIGYSIQGRLLLALKISDNVRVREDEPQFLYSSTMHGNETVGYVLLLRLADQLLSLYGRDSADGVRITRLVNSMEIWINPLANPDGTYRASDTTVTGARRGNANNVDLNRNFPDRINDTSNTTAGRQQETQAFMRWTAKHNFSLSANFHGGAQVVNYPWDNGAPSGSYSRHPDDTWWIALSRAYASPNPDMLAGGFPNGITNGCAWYVVYGGRQDWITHWYGGRETTIELWSTSNPSGSVLPQRWTNNRESFLAYMEYALKGVRGIVTDAATGRPLRARIDVDGFDGVPVFSDSAAGDYHRLLPPGTYTLRVRADGYAPDTLRNVVVRDTAATRADVPLRSTTVSVSDAAKRVPEAPTLHQNHPNPFNSATVIRYSTHPPDRPGGTGKGNGAGEAGVERVRLAVYDLLGREVAVLVDGPVEPGDRSVRFDASNLASGVYLYRLDAGGAMQTKRMILLR